jgi:hypothetical protein
MRRIWTERKLGVVGKKIRATQIAAKHEWRMSAPFCPCGCGLPVKRGNTYASGQCAIRQRIKATLAASKGTSDCSWWMNQPQQDWTERCYQRFPEARPTIQRVGSTG